MVVVDSTLLGAFNVENKEEEVMATQKDVNNYLDALKDAVKRRDKKMTKALLGPFVKRGGKLEDLYKMRRRKK